MLHRSEAFEPLTEDTWDEARARDGIREIVADTDHAFRGPRLLWRADDWDRWQGTSPMKNLYVGVAGVLWALDTLRRRGLAETRLDLAELALANLELFRARPDQMKIKLPEPRMASLLCGETGILLVAWRLAPSPELADALLERVRANVENEAEEVMWGTPGTLLPRGRCSSGLRRRAGARHGTRARKLFSRAVTPAVCGRSVCTARRSRASRLRTGSSGTCRRCVRSSTPGAGVASSRTRTRSWSGPP